MAIEPDPDVHADGDMARPKGDKGGLIDTGIVASGDVSVTVSVMVISRREEDMPDTVSIVYRWHPGQKVVDVARRAHGKNLSILCPFGLIIPFSFEPRLTASLSALANCSYR